MSPRLRLLSGATTALLALLALVLVDWTGIVVPGMLLLLLVWGALDTWRAWKRIKEDP
jgi:preprotein translocase subunit SecY